MKNELNKFACKRKQSFSKPVIECLRRIEKDEIVYISSCDLFHLSREFILSATGAALTYGAGYNVEHTNLNMYVSINKQTNKH